MVLLKLNIPVKYKEGYHFILMKKLYKLSKKMFYGNFGTFVFSYDSKRVKETSVEALLVKITHSMFLQIRALKYKKKKMKFSLLTCKMHCVHFRDGLF